MNMLSMILEGLQRLQYQIVGHTYWVVTADGGVEWTCIEMVSSKVVPHFIAFTPLEGTLLV